MKVHKFTRRDTPIVLHAGMFFGLALLAEYFTGVLGLPDKTTIQDISRTLLSLTSVLLGFLFAFYTMYVSLIESKRDRATQGGQSGSVPHENVAQRILEELRTVLIPLYRESERSFSSLVKIIAPSFLAIILVTYSVYLQSSTATWCLPFYSWGYQFTSLSPIITIADVLIVIWLIAREVGGRSREAQDRVMGGPTDLNRNQPIPG